VSSSTVTPTRGLPAWLQHPELLLSAGLLTVLVVMLVPLPTMLLDMLLAANLAMSILVLLITLNARQPLELSVFPSLLLLLTLYRLSLNVATTRLILIDADAGQIVEAFGNFVVGGNLVVGLVIFLILVVIQFIVITKGSGRISEVAARFTLDSLPGKQMAIDAEMNAGLLTEAEARQRRRNLTREAEFYGAMDGAGKFVRGDAIAGLIITFVNLLGGVVLGLANGLSFAQALKTYSVLTVGDGLVSQIPALIIATTAGILVTKASSEANLGQEIGTQLVADARPLWFGAAVLALISMTPGLPKLPFLMLSAGLALFVRRLRRAQAKAEQPASSDTPPALPSEEQQLEDFLVADRVGLEIGARLIPYVKSTRGKGIAERIAGLRRDFAQTNGIWVPSVRVRDSLQLEPEEYRILIAGREVARGSVRADLLLAIDPGHVVAPIEGEQTIDPAFQLPARWIAADERRRAELGGYTVVDAISVLMTHLGEVLRRHAHELLTREHLRKLLDKVREFSPTIVDELKPDVIRMGTLHQVLVFLAAEQVPITDLVLILESLINHGVQVKDPQDLLERVREDLGRTICDRYRSADGRLRVAVLDPRLEVTLRGAIKDRSLLLPPQQFERLIALLSEHRQDAIRRKTELALLTNRSLRRPLRQAISRALPDLGVLAYSEVPPDVMIEPTVMLRYEELYDGEDVSTLGAALVPAAAPTPGIKPALHPAFA
jgi:flagellar biosynthesis protein FlhA